MMTEVSLGGQGHAFLARLCVNQKKTQKSAQGSEGTDARQLACSAHFSKVQGWLYRVTFC